MTSWAAAAGCWNWEEGVGFCVWWLGGAVVGVEPQVGWAWLSRTRKLVARLPSWREMSRG